MNPREKNRLKVAKWRENNPEKARAGYKITDFRRGFGLEVSDYEALLAKQKGVCAVCNQAETALSNQGKVRKLAVDHCHATNVIRGLLCYRCNYILGLCKDSTQTLRGLALYLETANTGFIAEKKYAIKNESKVVEVRRALSIEEVNDILSDLLDI